MQVHATWDDSEDLSGQVSLGAVTAYARCYDAYHKDPAGEFSFAGDALLDTIWTVSFLLLTTAIEVIIDRLDTTPRARVSKIPLLTDHAGNEGNGQVQSRVEYLPSLTVMMCCEGDTLAVTLANLVYVRLCRGFIILTVQSVYQQLDILWTMFRLLRSHSIKARMLPTSMACFQEISQKIRIFWTTL